MLWKKRQCWLRRDFFHGFAQSEDRIITNGFLCQPKFWAEMLIFILFMIKIFYLPLCLSVLKESFLCTAIVMVTVYIKSLIHLPLKPLERLRQWNLKSSSCVQCFFRAAEWDNTFRRDFQKYISFFFSFKISLTMDEISEQSGSQHPHNHLFKEQILCLQLLTWFLDALHVKFFYFLASFAFLASLGFNGEWEVLQLWCYRVE